MTIAIFTCVVSLSAAHLTNHAVPANYSFILAFPVALLSSHLMVQLDIGELINCVWMKDDAKERSPNVILLVKSYFLTSLCSFSSLSSSLLSHM